MHLIYIGPHEAVEVPHDLVPDGAYIAERNGDPVDFPDDIAQGLLEQGQDSAEDDPTHQPQWIKATAKQIAAAKNGSTEASIEDKIKKAKAADLDAIAAEIGCEFAEGVSRVADKKAALLEHLQNAATDDSAAAADGADD